MPIIENERLSKTVADDIQQKIIGSELKVGDLLAEATQNPFFILVSRPITELLHSLYINKSGYMSFRETTYGEHRVIVDAIIAQDGDAAVTAIERHLDRVGTTIEKLIAENSGTKSIDNK